MSGARVLVVEDEPAMRAFLRASLEAAGHRVVEAATGSAGLDLASREAPSVAIVDLGLPDMEGGEVVRALRASAALPILILSARSDEAQKVAALDAGADDYLTKPFGVGELLARLRVALRRGAPARARPDRFGPLDLDLEARRVLLHGVPIHLTDTEFRLLAVLARKAGGVATHRQLLGEVWGAEYVEHTHYLRIYMAQLRRKLEPDPARPRILLTETGVGYRLAED